MDTAQKRTLAIVGVVGAGAAVLWFLAQQSGQVDTGLGPTLSQAAPELGGSNYQPTQFNVPPISITVPGQGNTILNMGGATTNVVGPTFNAGNGGAPGSADGVSPPCQCGCSGDQTATPSAFGSQLDQALALAPLTAAVDASVLPILTTNAGTYGDLNDMRAALARMQQNAHDLLASSVVAFNPGF